MKKCISLISFIAFICVGCATAASPSSPVDSYDVDVVVRCVDQRLQSPVAEWLKHGVNGHGESDRLSADELEALAVSVPTELRDAMSISAQLALKRSGHGSVRNYNRLNDEVIKNFMSVAPEKMGASMCSRHAGEIIYADVISAFGTILYPGYANSVFAKRLMRMHGGEAQNYYGNFLFLWLSLKFAGADPGFDVLSKSYRPSHSTGVLFIE